MRISRWLERLDALAPVPFTGSLYLIEGQGVPVPWLLKRDLATLAFELLVRAPLFETAVDLR